MRRLPPLDTLRVFEAAARLKSFKAAGDELNVTASAVSHRVATLEEELGTALFVRHTRRIELTREGERLAAGVRRGLAEIGRAVSSIDQRDRTRIRITGIPSHVTRWLAPRLHRFRAGHPDVELHVTADLAVADLTQRTFDVALRFGTGVYPGLHAEYLMDDWIFPVASPRYLAEAGPIDKAADMLSLTRILDVTPRTTRAAPIGAPGSSTIAFPPTPSIAASSSMVPPSRWRLRRVASGWPLPGRAWSERSCAAAGWCKSSRRDQDELAALCPDAA
jgi:LysR family glycine cleavage system transcriptional activator